MFIPPTWALLSTTQKVLVCLVVPPPYIFTYLCQVSSPGSAHLISTDNIHDQLRQYPYDFILYHPYNVCKTCAFPKPARSKHCSLCGTCVARCDHHCVWVNNCVGRGNYKYFLGLLSTTTLTLVYGTYLAYTTLIPQVHWHFETYPEWYVTELSGGSDVVSRVFDHLTYCLDVFQTGLGVGGLRRAGVGLLAAMTWPLPLGLLAYHLYLIWAGTTTNETAKWEDWREDMAEGVVYIADMKEHESSSEGREGRSRDRNSGVPRWPHTSKHFVVRTNDGQRPRLVANGISELIVDDSWRQIWRLADIENIYDLGFWDNLKESLVN